MSNVGRPDRETIGSFAGPIFQVQNWSPHLGTQPDGVPPPISGSTQLKGLGMASLNSPLDRSFDYRPSNLPCSPWQQPKLPPGFDIPPLPYKSSDNSSSIDSICTTDSPTQTEANATTEKFLLYESILAGCDELKKMDVILPAKSNLIEYSENVKDSLISSLSPTVCSQLTSGATEATIIASFAQSFLMISETWLACRNCFGVTDRCSSLCSLESNDMPLSYLAWVQASRRLLDSMVNGLKKVNLMHSKDLSPNVVKTEKIKVKSRCQQLKAIPNKYAGLSCPMLPIPPQAFVSELPKSSEEYLKPSSYFVPRKELTPTGKKRNIAQATASVGKSALETGYIVPLPVAPVSTEKPEEVQNALKNQAKSEQDSKERFSTVHAIKRRSSLTQLQTASIQELLQFLFKSDLPQSVKCSDENWRAVKRIQYSISLEHMEKKLKNGVYDTVEQFTQDCGQLFSKAVCTENVKEAAKTERVKSDFRNLLRVHFPLDLWRNV